MPSAKEGGMPPEAPQPDGEASFTQPSHEFWFKMAGVQHSSHTLQPDNVKPQWSVPFRNPQLLGVLHHGSGMPHMVAVTMRAFGMPCHIQVFVTPGGSGHVNLLFMSGMGPEPKSWHTGKNAARPLGSVRLSAQVSHP